MKKIDITKITAGAQAFMSKHSPEILVGIGVAGAITSAILSAKATVKAVRLVDAAEAEKGEPLTKKEVVKTCWKCYIPTVATVTASTACVIGASKVHTKRNAALATAYQLSESALAKYSEKVVETIGEKKEEAIKAKVNKEKLDNNPVENTKVIITGKGETLCCDVLFGRYFESDIDKIKRAIAEINYTLVCDGYVSLNDFYDELGLDHIDVGDDLGWKVDQGKLDVDFGSQIASDGRPCITIEYSVAPKYGYDSFS